MLFAILGAGAIAVLRGCKNCMGSKQYWATHSCHRCGGVVMKSRLGYFIPPSSNSEQDREEQDSGNNQVAERLTVGIPAW